MPTLFSKYSKPNMIIYLLIIVVILIGLATTIYYLSTRKQPKQNIIYKKTPSKCLVILYGESFRLPKTIEEDELIDINPIEIEQKIATLSHIDLINNINWKYKIDADVIVSTKSDYFKNEIKTWFRQYLWSKEANVQIVPNAAISNSNFTDEKEMETRWREFLKSALEKVDRKKAKEYQFILFIRSDAYLKPAFFELFDPSSKKVVFTSRHSMYDNSINNTTVYIPSVKFDKFFEGDGKSKINLDLNVPNFIKEYGLKDEKDISFMIEGEYNIDTSVASNPLYRTVNRVEKED